MQSSTVLFIILAAIVALGAVLFQYYYKSKKRGKRTILLSFLRFIGLFGLLILVINPKFTKNEYTLEKANLVILTDNSSSINASKVEVAAILEKIDNNAAITEKFQFKKYVFGSVLKDTDSLSFTAKNTNISKALSALNEVYANTKTAIVVLTDGNQTIGEDYSFYGNRSKLPIYPIAVGDTTQYEDVRIGTINSNKYAFLKNKFPLEISVSYAGQKDFNATVTIAVNGKNAYRETVKLSNIATTKTINALLNANSVGIKNITVTVNSIANERNTTNNQKNIAIEVIDEKTNIVIVSAVMHPDIGALKKAIERNEQRSVSIKKPNMTPKDLDEVDVFVLYQPNASFSAIYKYIQQKKSSAFTITGEVINSNFLNSIQKTFRVQGGYPVQETFPVLNSGFSKFDISEFSIDEFPPLNNGAGIIQGQGVETLLQMKILGRTLASPLLLASDNENGKELVLFGENLWKWRAQSFRNNQNFENFDAFIGKLMLYLSSNRTKNRLDVEYASIYEGSNEAKIKASYFDEAFVFDANANLVLKLKNKEDGNSREIPMLLKNNFYEADLTDLPANSYAFTVSVVDEKRSESGDFTILDFDVEQQFLTTDYKKLKQLAFATQGALYFPSKTDDLVQQLLNDSQFVPTQKSTKNVVSLIDFRILLAIIVAALAAEWFIRKYNGLT